MWQWSEIPGTALSGVEPSPRPLGSNGPRSKIEAWCGASLKRKGSVYLLGAAGGHGDYAGNEVNALVLNTEQPHWEQLRAPSEAAMVVNGVQFYLDNRPSATHTYYATQFIESTNRLVVIGSPGINGLQFAPAPANYPYTGSSRSFSFDLSKGDWDGPDHFAVFPGTGDFTACLCVKHPVTDDIFYSRSYAEGWYQWVASKNQWLRRNGNTRNPWYCGAAIDPGRERMLTVGGYSAVAPRLLDLDGRNLGQSFGGLGADALTLSGYPAVLYDEALDQFLVLHNTPQGQIRTVHVDAATFQVVPAPLHGNEPASRKNGLHNAPQYVPELRGVVLANSYSGNVLFMRTSA